MIQPQTLFFLLALSAVPALSQGNGFMKDPTITTPQTQQASQCYFFNDVSAYDLKHLTNPTKDYSVKDTASGKEYTFNFCQFAHNPLANQSGQAFAYRYPINQTNNAEALTNAQAPAVSNLITTWYTEETGESTESTILQVTYNGGAQCDGAASSVTYLISCDQNGDITKLPDQNTFVVNGTSKCHPTITFAHKAGCSQSAIVSSGWSHDPIEEIRYLFATNHQLYMFQQMICIILGLYLAFRGRGKSNEIIGLAFGYSVFIVTLAYFWNLSSLGNNSYIPAIILGILVGYHAYWNLAHLFVATLGALVGCIFALIIVSLFQVDNDLIVYALIAGGIFIGFTGHFLDDHIELWLSAVCGSYLIVEGLTTFLGGLPSFAAGIQDLLKGGQYYAPATILYLVLFAGLSFYGARYQRKH